MAKNDDRTRNTGTIAGETKLPDRAGTAAVTDAENQQETKKAQAPTTPAKRAPKAAPGTDVRDVDEYIAARNLPRWVGESIKVYAGWKSGKQVSAEEFKTALDGWNKRRQGGGRQ